MDFGVQVCLIFSLVLLTHPSIWISSLCGLCRFKKTLPAFLHFSHHDYYDRLRMLSLECKDVLWLKQLMLSLFLGRQSPSGIIPCKHPVESKEIQRADFEKPFVFEMSRLLYLSLLFYKHIIDYNSTCSNEMPLPYTIMVQKRHQET